MTGKRDTRTKEVWKTGWKGDGERSGGAEMTQEESEELLLRIGGGIVKLTHHKLKQPQDIGSKTMPEYSIWGLVSRQPVNSTARA